MFRSVLSFDKYIQLVLVNDVIKRQSKISVRGRTLFKLLRILIPILSPTDPKHNSTHGVLVAEKAL